MWGGFVLRQSLFTIGHLGEVPLPEDLGVFGREPGALEEQPVLQAPPVLELPRPSKSKAV